jgi:serine/threonine protein kinase
MFALGCTLAFAATARVTFGDDSLVSVVYRITTEPPDLTGVTEEHGFRQLVSECLAKNPADRPSLATILERLAQTGSAAESAPPVVAAGAASPLAAEPPPYPYMPPAQPASGQAGFPSGGRPRSGPRRRAILA